MRSKCGPARRGNPPAGTRRGFRQIGVRRCARARIRKLRRRQRDADDGDAVFARRQLGEAAPAAADFQHRHAGLQPQYVAQPANLACICAPSSVSCEPREHGRGIGHRGIEPRLVEIVAQVVMFGDVALAGAFARVGPQLVQQLGRRPHPRPALQHLQPFRLVHRRDGHHAADLGAVPQPVQIGFRKAQAAAGDQPRHRARGP